MFVIETESGNVRLESVEEARTYLEACLPGAELTVRGLGRLVFRGGHPTRGRFAPGYPGALRVLFYPVGRLGPQKTCLADIVAMLPAMVDKTPGAAACGRCEGTGWVDYNARAQRRCPQCNGRSRWVR